MALGSINRINSKDSELCTVSVQQCFSIPVLITHCPACFRCFPPAPHQIQNQLVIKLCSDLIRSHSFESGVVEEGNMENMQGSGS